jgi:hypothetical protein
LAKFKTPNHEKNQDTEDAGLLYLKKMEKGIHVPTKEQRQQILVHFGISKKFGQTFDAVRLKVKKFEDVKTALDFELIEVKVTQKELANFPKGFFFGMTENEEMLLKVFEPNFKLCLVSLFPGAEAHRMFTYSELEAAVRNKRIQYQINL